MNSIASPLEWGLFAAVVFVALALDLGVFHRAVRKVTMKEAAVWTTVWCLLGLGFNAFVFRRYGTHKGLEFFQGWLLELALSVDNVFVFLVIFRYFHVAEKHQHPVLFWGIIGAVVARGAFIGTGVAIVERFHFVMYGLGAFLVFTAGKILFQKDEEMDPSKNLVLRLFHRLVPSSKQYDGAHFVTRQNGRLLATPLLAVLVVVDAADVMFAADSIPAVLGVTTDVFIVLTSNVFAILGLRSLFFLVAALVQKLRFLKIGVAAILAFIGAKILLEMVYKVPVAASLAGLGVILALTAIASLLFPGKPQAASKS